MFRERGERGERERGNSNSWAKVMEAAMAEALLFGEREAQVMAAMEIGKLNCKQKQRLAEKEVISSLVFMLHSQNHHQSIEAALFALLNLAFGSERNKVRIAKCGAIQAIVEILQWAKESLFELALAALFILSSSSANKPLITSSGAVQLLVRLMDTRFPIGDQAKLDIISTLHNLSTSSQIIHSTLLSHGLISLIQLIYVSDKSSDLVEKAVSLLESLVSMSDVALNQVCENGGVIGSLVEAVEEGTGQCKEHAVGILVLICRSCRERYRGMILREGAMPGLLQLSVEGTRRGREKAKALLFMLRDCSNGGSKHPKNALLEEVMREIDSVGRVGTCIQLVEETIAKLRTR